MRETELIPSGDRRLRGKATSEIDRILTLQREIAEQDSRETAWATKFEDQLRHFDVRMRNQRRRLLLARRGERRQLRDAIRAARAEIERLKADKERLDWLEQQVHEHLYCSDIAIQSDEDDGVWFSKIYRHDCGELKGESYDPTDCKTQTVREAIDAARASEEK